MKSPPKATATTFRITQIDFSFAARKRPLRVLLHINQHFTCNFFEYKHSIRTWRLFLASTPFSLVLGIVTCSWDFRE